jgi:hypothetical protein
VQRSPKQDDELVVVGEFPGVLRVRLWRNVVIASWYGDPSAHATVRLAALTGEILGRMDPSTKVSYVHLVTRKLRLPDAATRTAFTESTNKFASRSALAAVVVSGGGFWASAIRGFVTSIAVLAPRSLDVRIYGAIDDLVPWFPTEHVRRTGVELDVQVLLRNLTHAQGDHSSALSA